MQGHSSRLAQAEALARRLADLQAQQAYVEARLQKSVQFLPVAEREQLLRQHEEDKQRARRAAAQQGPGTNRRPAARSNGERLAHAHINSSPCMEHYDLYQLLHPEPSKAFDDGLITKINHNIINRHVTALQLRMLCSLVMEKQGSSHIRNPSSYFMKLLSQLEGVLKQSRDIMAAIDELLKPAPLQAYTAAAERPTAAGVQGAASSRAGTSPAPGRLTSDDLAGCPLPEFVKVWGGLLAADPCHTKCSLRNIPEQCLRVVYRGESGVADDGDGDDDDDDDAEEDLEDFNPFAPDRCSDDEDDDGDSSTADPMPQLWLAPLLQGNEQGADDILVDEEDAHTGQQLPSSGDVLEQLPYNVGVVRAHPGAVMWLAAGKFRVTSTVEQILSKRSSPLVSVVPERRPRHTQPIIKRSAFEKLPVLGVKRVGIMVVARSDAKLLTSVRGYREYHDRSQRLIEDVLYPKALQHTQLTRALVISPPQEPAEPFSYVVGRRLMELLLERVAPLVLSGMNDLGTLVMPLSITEQDLAGYMYVYDQWGMQGDSPLIAKAYNELTPQLFSAMADTIRACPCTAGCPKCVRSNDAIKEEMLQALADFMPAPVGAAAAAAAPANEGADGAAAAAGAAPAAAAGGNGDEDAVLLEPYRQRLEETEGDGFGLPVACQPLDAVDDRELQQTFGVQDEPAVSAARTARTARRSRRELLGPLFVDADAPPASCRTGGGGRAADSGSSAEEEGEEEGEEQGQQEEAPPATRLGRRGRSSSRASIRARLAELVRSRLEQQAQGQRQAGRDRQLRSGTGRMRRTGEAAAAAAAAIDAHEVEDIDMQEAVLPLWATQPAAPAAHGVKRGRARVIESDDDD